MSTTFERHLPASWPGYLLKSSVKLGLEGHRQDHCVASYASLVEAGACAIATVLVDRKRWTVELVKTGKADAPLRIAQIHGKRNSKPDGSATTRDSRGAAAAATGPRAGR